MAKIKITQVVSRIGSTARQKRNLDALGIKKMGRTVVHEDSPIILGMIEKVKHLVKVEATEEAPKAKKAAPKKETAPKTEKAPKTEEAPVAEAVEAAEPVKED